MNAPNAPQADPVVPVEPPRARFAWLLFLLALFVPPMLTTLAALMDRKGASAPALMFLGGAAGGIVAGTVLGCRIGGSTRMKVGLSVIFAGIMAVVVITMCGFGCAAGGYQLDFR